MNVLTEKVSQIYEMTMKKLTMVQVPESWSFFHAGLIFASYDDNWHVLHFPGRTQLRER